MAKSKYKIIENEYKKGVIDEFINWYENSADREGARFLEGARRKYAPIWHKLKKSFLRETGGNIRKDNEN